MRPGLIALAHVARHTQPALLSLDNSRTPDGMRSLHAPAVSRNVERSADETAEGSHNCGEVVALIGSEPTKLDQRVDCAALDFEHEADFARRTQRRAYSHLERPLDKIDQRTGERILVAAIGGGQPAQLDQIGSHFRPDVKADADVSLPAAISGSPHAERGGRQWSHL